MKEFDLIKDPLTKAVNCLEASAGTGKTYALTWIYLRLLLEQNEKMDPGNILVVTFTKAATAELRDRIRKRLVEALTLLTTGQGSDETLRDYFNGLPDEKKQGAPDLLKSALEIFDLAAIYTIDSFCQRTLRDAAMESGVPFDLELIPSQADFVRETATDYCRRQLFSSTALLAGAAIQSEITPETLTDLLDKYLKHPQLRLVTGVKPRPANEVDAALISAFGAVVEQWRAVGGMEPLADFFATTPESTWAKSKHKKRSDVLAYAEQIASGISDGKGSPDFWGAVDYFSHGFVSGNVRAKQQMPANPPAAIAFFKACEKLSQLIVEHHAAHRVEFLESARKVLSEKKQRCKQASFSDQISRLKEALAGPGGKALANTLRKRYHAALIDESQDTDPLQWEIFERVFAETQGSHWLYLIGDPKQAIYRFRGADVYTYLKASESTPPGNRYTLGTNWRSEERLVHAVNAIFSPTQAGTGFPVFLEEQIQFLPVTPGPKADKTPIQFTRDKNIPRPAPLQVWKWEPTDGFVTRDDAKKRLPRVVAAEISRLLSSDVELGTGRDAQKLKPRDIAVLVESHDQADWVQQALHDLKIPSVEKTQESVFQSAEAREMQWILLAILAPGREAGIKVALTTDAMGISGNELADLVINENSWQQQIQKFVRYHEIWETDGFFTMILEFIRAEHIAESLLRFPNAERRITNLMQVAELMEAARKDEHLGPARLVQWLEDRRQGGDDAPEDHQLRLESDEDAVQIVTMHSSKGLEYPVVFCPFILKGAVNKHSKATVFYHDSSGTLCWDIDPEPSKQNLCRAAKENLADKVRLLYVALTRARNRCYLVSARYSYFSKNNPTALAWVLQQRATLPEDPVGELKDLEENWQAPWNEIKALADGHCSNGEAIAIADLPPAEPGNEWSRPNQSEAPLQCRVCRRTEIKPSWFLTSFSGISGHISAELAAARSGEEDVLPDRDSAVAEPEIAIAEAPVPPTGIFALPAGTRTGDCLHKILEQYDFQNPDPAKTGELVRWQLESAGLSFSDHAEAVLQMLERVRHAPLSSHPEGTFTLADIPADQRLVELEFHFPAGAIPGQQLMAVIHDSKNAGAPATPLPPPQIGAYMKGFIDLVFEHNGRYHIIDWKSNRLGLTTADYNPVDLKAQMKDSLYDLQYHLYTVALDKFLRQRIPEYDYETHFGGVHYLFLRGLDDSRPEYGVFYHRPEKSTIERLSQLFQYAKA